MHQIPFLESCPGCGGFVEISTESDYIVLNAFFAQVGDRVRCTQCSCVGEILAGAFGNTCSWNDEVCIECEASIRECIRSLLL